MKAKITESNGTVMELEGTAEELALFVNAEPEEKVDEVADFLKQQAAAPSFPPWPVIPDWRITYVTTNEGRSG